MNVSVYTVFFNSFLMSLMSILGAMNFLFMTKVSKVFKGYSSAMASGVMISCSFDLISNGEQYNRMVTFIGILIGIAFVINSQNYLEQYEHFFIENFKNPNFKKALLFITIMFAHAIGEGIGTFIL